jgi:FdhD protein
VLRIDGPATSDVLDEVAIEEPLEIRIGGLPVTVTMRTPGNDLELVAGLLLAERMIEPATKPVVRQEHPNIVNVAMSRLAGTVERMQRRAAVATSCGLCGKSRIEGVHQHFPPITGTAEMSQEVLVRAFADFAESQPVFARTGAVHAAGLFHCSGRQVIVREDVGRHNAVDKAIGYCVLRGLVPLPEHVLLVSGRASFEIVQKALGAGVPIVAAVSAPSSLAVELASDGGQTLLGFVRGGRFNVYTHPERIQPAAGEKS